MTQPRAVARLGERRLPAGPARATPRPSACSTSGTSCTPRTSTSARRFARAAAGSCSRPTVEVVHLRGPLGATAPGRHARARTAAASSRSTRSTIPRWAPLLRCYLRSVGRRSGAHGLPALRQVSCRRAHRHRRAQAARLRHRHLHPQPAAAARAPRPRHRVRRVLPARRSRRRSAALGANFRPVAGNGRQLLDRRAGADSARAPARGRHAVSRAALRAAAARAVPVGRDDPRLHPPDVSAVPAEPAGARLRADVDHAWPRSARRGC